MINRILAILAIIFILIPSTALAWSEWSGVCTITEIQPKWGSPAITVRTTCSDTSCDTINPGNFVIDKNTFTSQNPSKEEQYYLIVKAIYAAFFSGKDVQLYHENCWSPSNTYIEIKSVKVQ